MKEASGGGSWRGVDSQGGREGGRGEGRVVDGRRSTQFNKEHSKVRERKKKSAAEASLPSVVLDHVSQLDDELSLFVFLTALKRVLLKTHRQNRGNLASHCQQRQQNVKSGLLSRQK